MKKRLAAAVLLSAAAQVSASTIYEQFNYSTGSLGTTGSPTWTATTSGTGDISVISTDPSLQYTDANAGYGTTIGIPAGNDVSIPNAAAKSDRIATTGLPTGSGTLFYSLLMKVTNLTGVTTSGAFIAGFNNSTGTATSSITQAGARLQIRKDAADATKFNIGVRSDVSASTGTSVLGWDSAQHAAGETIFIVGEYEFNQASSTDDVSRIWINPNPADLGAAVAPTENASSTGGDINQLQIQSFFLRALSGGGTTTIDEIRIDNSWAGVTTVPEPASLGLLALGAMGLMRRRK